MPVLLRSVGFGSNRNRNLRPTSSSSNDRNRRVSQVSGTHSTSASTTRGKDDRLAVQSKIHEEVEVEETKMTIGQRLHKMYKDYHIKYLFPLAFIMVYMLIGAVIFYFLESGSAEEEANRENWNYKRERRLLFLRLEEIMQDPATKRRPNRKKALEEAMDNFEQKMNFNVKNVSQWTFMSAMYFAGTLFTTIGYGDIACTTSWGRVATVIYSCVGIPFMLITLNDLGKFLYNNINGCVKGFEDFTTYLGAFNFRRRRDEDLSKIDELAGIETNIGTIPSIEVSSLASELGSERNESDYDEIEDEEERAMPRMSVKVALGITVGWIFFCSSLFKLWEDWTYAESCYFMFISLSTIGLGDISVARRDMMVLCFVFVIVGLSLVSMTINVIQVALEDFYVNMMMKLIIEYQEKMAAGGDQMGASVGMMRMWGNNKTAKLLMPLLSKEKKKMAMEKVEVKAKNNGFEVPTILTDLDEKSGMPKLFHIGESKEEGEEHSKLLTDLVQKQIDIEEAAAENAVMKVAHDANTQTDILVQDEKGHQTDEKVYEETATMTDIEEKTVENLEVETQTDSIHNNIAETQTVIVDHNDEETNTIALTMMESDSQTEIIQTKEEELQTYIDMIDAETIVEIETKNIRIQTPQPVIEQKCVQTEDLEDRKSPSKMSSAKKRLRRAFATKSKPTRSSLDHPVMSDWKDVVEEDEEEEEDGDETGQDEEEPGSVESLHWDPVDGMHAEKQLPVKKLKAMFDSPKGQRKVERKSSSFSRKRENSRSRNKSE